MFCHKIGIDKIANLSERIVFSLELLYGVDNCHIDRVHVEIKIAIQPLTDGLRKNLLHFLSDETDILFIGWKISRIAVKCTLYYVSLLLKCETRLSYRKVDQLFAFVRRCDVILK